jgi:hypothetical protein
MLAFINYTTPEWNFAKYLNFLMEYDVKMILPSVTYNWGHDFS